MSFLSKYIFRVYSTLHCEHTKVVLTCLVKTSRLVNQACFNRQPTTSHGCCLYLVLKKIVNTYSCVDTKSGVSLPILEKNYNFQILVKIIGRGHFECSKVKQTSYERITNEQFFLYYSSLIGLARVPHI